MSLFLSIVGWAFLGVVFIILFSVLLILKANKSVREGNISNTEDEKRHALSSFKKLFSPNVNKMKAKQDIPGLIKLLSKRGHVSFDVKSEDLNFAWRAALALVELGPTTIKLLQATNYPIFATIALGMLGDMSYRTMEELRRLVKVYFKDKYWIPNIGSIGRVAAIILCNTGDYLAAGCIIEGIENQEQIDGALLQAIEKNISCLSIKNLHLIYYLLHNKIYPNSHQRCTYDYRKDFAIDKILGIITVILKGKGEEGRTYDKLFHELSEIILSKGSLPNNPRIRVREIGEKLIEICGKSSIVSDYYCQLPVTDEMSEIIKEELKKLLH